MREMRLYWWYNLCRSRWMLHVRIEYVEIWHLFLWSLLRGNTNYGVYPNFSNSFGEFNLSYQGTVVNSIQLLFHDLVRLSKSCSVINLQEIKNSAQNLSIVFFMLVQNYSLFFTWKFSEKHCSKSHFPRLNPNINGSVISKFLFFLYSSHFY